MSIRMTMLRALPSGRYTVTLQRGSGAHTTVSIESVTIAGR